MTLALYSSWRASAPYRVRLALAWKGLHAAAIPVDLRMGEQSGAVKSRLHRARELVREYLLGPAAQRSA